MRSKLLVLAVVAIGIALAGAHTDQVWVSGTGIATEPEKGAAKIAAIERATERTNNMCVGAITSTEITDICTASGEDNNPQYVCTATVKRLCEAPSR